MLKKKIEYTDYNGDKQIEYFYFNLSKAEVLRMESSYDGGMTTMLTRIINERDNTKIYEFFEKLVQDSYGEKSDDGKRFVKKRDGRRLVDDFIDTSAYSELIYELATSADKAAEFVNGVLPKELVSGDLNPGDIDGIPPEVVEQLHANRK